MKTCPKCHETKALTEFHKDKYAADGLKHRCKWCVSHKNKDRHGPCDYKMRTALARATGLLTCRDCGIEKSTSEFYTNGNRGWQSRCVECYRAYQNARLALPHNSAKVRERAKARRGEPGYYARYEEWRRARMAADPLFAAKCLARNAVRGAFGRTRKHGFRKGSRTQTLIGCSWQELIDHLAALCYGGMTIDDVLANDGRVHIDHIVPIATAETEEDVVRLNHYTNLQPLWAEDNLEKGDRTDWVHPRDRVQ